MILGSVLLALHVAEFVIVEVIRSVLVSLTLPEKDKEVLGRSVLEFSFALRPPLVRDGDTLLVFKTDAVALRVGTLLEGRVLRVGDSATVTVAVKKKVNDIDFEFVCRGSLVMERLNAGDEDG